ncbi:MAG: hypothetical protein ACKV2O_00050 [Acidimicrobiales bacterium]
MAKAADTVKSSTEYYNSRDFDRWLACYATDATFVDLSQGVNDGAFGAFPATGKRVSFPVINVITVNAQGEIATLEQHYDRVDILTQLGHMPAS